jgi:hypothetical protein
MLLAALAAIMLGGPASLMLGALLGPAFGVGIVAGAVIGRRIAGQVVISPVARALAGGSAGLLGILGVVFRSLLVENPSDNAYLWILTIGHALFLPAIVFALMPVVSHDGVRTWLLREAITLVWVLAIPAQLLLLLGVVLSVTSSQGLAPDMRVAVNHVIAIVLLAGVLYVVGYWWPRRLTRV